MAMKKKPTKMDRHLVSSDQEWEIVYISREFQIPKAEVLKAVNKVGLTGSESRALIYDELRLMGWTIEVGKPRKPKLAVCTLLPDPKKKLPAFPSRKSAKGGRGRKPKPVPQPIPTPPSPTPTPTPIPPPSSGGVSCLFFNFNGGVMQSPSWNGGQAVTLAPAPFSDTDKAAMMLHVQEEYARYNVTVTDDVNVYNNAAQRQQVYVTPTSAWYPNTGYSGVTMIGSLFSTSDIPCFVFCDRLFNNAVYTAQIMIHESGHAVGLRHQSTYNDSCLKLAEYKPGCHMGSPFNVPRALWVYQACSNQHDQNFLQQKLGLR